MPTDQQEQEKGTKQNEKTDLKSKVFDKKEDVITDDPQKQLDSKTKESVDNVIKIKRRKNKK